MNLTNFLETEFLQGQVGARKKISDHVRNLEKVGRPFPSSLQKIYKIHVVVLSYTNNNVYRHVFPLILYLYIQVEMYVRKEIRHVYVHSVNKRQNNNQ